MKIREDLEFDYCGICDKVHPRGMGIIERISLPCCGNKIMYRPGSFTLRKLANAIMGVNPMESFKSLLKFNHLQAMPDYKTASELDKLIYSIGREDDIRTLKRMMAYVKIEEEFDSKY